MKQSPFSSTFKPAVDPVLADSLRFKSPQLPAAVVSSPLAKVQSQSVVAATIISNSDIESLGSDLSRGVSQTTDKLIQKMTVNRFGELGSILANVELQIGKLETSKVSDSGVIAWFQSKFTDIRKTLTMNFQTAQQAFVELETQMTNQIAVHQEWIKNLEALYAENYAHYQKIVDIIKTSEGWDLILSEQLKNWAPVDPTDPEGPMKIQVKNDAQSTLNRLNIKIDMFRRLKALTENNGPKIRTQQETSRTAIQTLNDTIVQVIPLIKMEFAMYLQTLDSDTAINTVNQAKSLANTSMQKSSDAAKNAALNSAKTLNTPMISNESLAMIRTKMLETVTGIQQINAQAQQQRIADAKALADGQAQYLTQLQQHGAI